MTGLAPHTRVLALALLASDIGVTAFASFVPGELDRPSADVVQSSGAKVPILAKLGRNDGSADQEECDDSYGQEEYYPEQVLRVSKEILHALGSMQFGGPAPVV